jgi:hypothetical protein
MSTAEPDPTTPACPPWCTLPLPHHPWDSVHDDRDVRGHQGPRFGRYVSAGSFEYADDEGVHVFDISLDAAVESDIRTPAQARTLAAELLAAAEWVEISASRSARSGAEHA